MLAQCPHCRTVFAVAEAQLKAAGGRVRCGHCFNPFNALNHLVEGGATRRRLWTARQRPERS